MAYQIELVKQSYNKNEYEKVIDTQFTQLVQPVGDTIPYIRLPTFPAPHRLKNSKNASYTLPRSTTTPHIVTGKQIGRAHV